MNYKEFKENTNHSGAYLFFGEEKYLIEVAVGRVIYNYVKESKAFNYTKFKNGEVKPEDIISACETYPVMNDKKVVLVKDVCDFLAIYELKDSFYEFLDHLSDFVILIFWDTGSIKKNTKFYNYFRKNHREVNFEKLAGAQLNKFIKLYFKNKDKIINDTEVAILIQNSGYTSKNKNVALFDLNSEMDKIAAVAKNKVIKESDIRSVTIENIDTNIFKFLDAMMGRSREESLKELHNLYKLGEPSLKIFTMVIRQVKNLLSYKILSTKNISQNDIMNKMEVKNFELKKIRDFERNFSKEFLINFYEELIKTDELFKTSSIDEKLIMETLIVKYCNKN